MLIGLTLGAMAIRSSIKGPTTVALAAPVAVWAIPILDSLAAIVRRKLTGRSVYATDRGHLHHCLMEKFGSPRRTLAWIVSCCVVTSLGALATVQGNSDLYALLSIAAVASVLVTTRLFGHAEARLVANSLKTSGASLLRGRRRSSSPTDSIHWQGSADWELLMNSLVELADRFNLSRVWLDVAMPSVQEGYRGSWQRPTAARHDELWRVDMPLFGGTRMVGRLSVEGEPGGLSASQLIEHLDGRRTAVRRTPGRNCRKGQRRDAGAGDRPSAIGHGLGRVAPRRTGLMPSNVTPKSTFSTRLMRGNPSW